MSMAVSGGTKRSPQTYIGGPQSRKGPRLLVGRAQKAFVASTMRALARERLPATRREPHRVASETASLYPCRCDVTTGKTTVPFLERLQVACFAPLET